MYAECLNKYMFCSVLLTSFGGSLYGPSLVYIIICYVFVNK